MKRKIILALCLLSCSQAVFPAQTWKLRWNLQKDERLEMVRTASVTLYLNSMAVKKYDERNIIDLTCYRRDGDDQQMKGGFSVFMKESGENVFRIERREQSDFTIKPDGSYNVPLQFLMPNLRHIPTFPAKDVAVGESWSAPAELVLDHLSRPLALQFQVKYRLDEVKNIGGHDVAKISYTYIIDENLAKRRIPPDFPQMVAARDKGTIMWDITGQHPRDGSDQYDIIFLQPDGVTTVQFKMNIFSGSKVYAVVQPDEKDKAKKDLEKDLGDRKGITVDTDPRGLVLRMGEVLFNIDSAALRDDTRKTLDSVVDILKKKYPDREIYIEGHTDSTGDKAYNQALSEKRAKSVAEYIGKNVGHDKMSFRGYGADRPIDDNTKESGRARNRRVEIVIKMN